MKKVNSPKLAAKIFLFYYFIFLFIYKRLISEMEGQKADVMFLKSLNIYRFLLLGPNNITVSLKFINLLILTTTVLCVCDL